MITQEQMNKLAEEFGLDVSAALLNFGVEVWHSAFNESRPVLQCGDCGSHHIEVYPDT